MSPVANNHPKLTKSLVERLVPLVLSLLWKYLLFNDLLDTDSGARHAKVDKLQQLGAATCKHQVFVEKQHQKQEFNTEADQVIFDNPKWYNLCFVNMGDGGGQGGGGASGGQEAAPGAGGVAGEPGGDGRAG